MVMRYLLIAGFGLAVLSLVVLHLGAYDFGFFDFRMLASDLALFALLTFLISTALCAFAHIQVVTGEKAAQEARYFMLQTEMGDNISSIEKKLEKYFGDEFEIMKSQNKNLNEEIVKLKSIEQDKLISENELLKEQNSILRKQIESNIQKNEENLANSDNAEIDGKFIKESRA